MATNRTITPQDIAAARRLKKLWDQRKHKHGFTQASVAKQFGYTQSAVSQYLSGTIALNTDTVLNFAKILRCQPEDIRPEFSAMLFDLPIREQQLKITKTSSGEDIDMRIKTKFIGDRKAYAILIDEDSYNPRIKKGEVIIADPVARIEPGDEVLVETQEGSYLVRNLIKLAQKEIKVGNILNDQIETIPTEKVKHIHAIIAIQRKAEI